jgi:lipoprotein-anchoring transpeptidase ErfK/SrfK
MRCTFYFKLLVLILSVCLAASNADASKRHQLSGNFASRMPQHIDTGGEKVILVDPNVHAWGAYDADGNLVRGGVATSGGNYCPDIHRRCHTKSGTFRIYSLGSSGCKSSIYPLPRGGAPMPYCMFFNKNQALHGSYEVRDGNASHGCVRLLVPDAEWIRFNFATVGTKVIVRPY